MDDVWLARSANLPGVMLDAEVPRLADEGDVFAGAIGLDLAEHRLKPLVNRRLGDGSVAGWDRMGRGNGVRNARSNRTPFPGRSMSVG